MKKYKIIISAGFLMILLCLVIIIIQNTNNGNNAGESNQKASADSINQSIDENIETDEIENHDTDIILNDIVDQIVIDDSKENLDINSDEEGKLNNIYSFINEMYKNYEPYYEIYNASSEFQEIKFRVETSEEAIKAGYLIKDGYYYYVTGPYYAEETDYVFISIKNNISSKCIIGISRDINVTNISSNGFTAANIDYPMSIITNDDNSYYVFIAFENIDNIEGTIYIPYSIENELNSSDILVQYDELKQFQLYQYNENNYSNGMNVKFIANSIKAELLASENENIYYKYNENYYKLNTAIADDELIIEVFVDYDDSEKHRVCTPFILYIPSDMEGEFITENNASIIKSMIDND